MLLLRWADTLLLIRFHYVTPSNNFVTFLVRITESMLSLGKKKVCVHSTISDDLWIVFSWCR